MKHHFAFILRGDTSQIFALGFGDAKFFVGVAHLLGQVVPLAHLFGGGLQVIKNVLEIEFRHIDGEPFGHRLFVEGGKRAQTHLAHPLGLTFPPRDLLHHTVIETLFWSKGIFDVVAPTQ